MKRILRVLALLLVLGAVAWWLAAGANRGWTKTSIPKSVTDEVTGIETLVYEERFVPGVEVLGAALLGAGILAVLSVVIPSRNPMP